MNLMKYRSVKNVGAALICAAGLLTATSALANPKGGGGHGGGHGGNVAELESVKCEVENGRISVSGKVVGPGKQLVVAFEAEGKAVTKCINPAGIEVEAQGGKSGFFAGDSSDKIKELKKNETKGFSLYDKVETGAKCEDKTKRPQGQGEWKAITKLDFAFFKVWLEEKDKKTSEVLDKWECSVTTDKKKKKHQQTCECVPVGKAKKPAEPEKPKKPKKPAEPEKPKKKY